LIERHLLILEEAVLDNRLPFYWFADFRGHVRLCRAGRQCSPAAQFPGAQRRAAAPQAKAAWRMLNARIASGN